MAVEELSGRVALVTGGGRGLGRAFSLALARAGMSVAITARSAAQLAETEAAIRQHGGRAFSAVADVSDPPSVQALSAQVEEALGPVDLLVNNAGAIGPCGPVWKTDPMQWWSCLETNLRGAFLVCHAVLPSMLDRGRGRIINVASGTGAIPVPYVSAYTVSKAALIRFTETLALETRPHGIAVFAIHPGTVRTAMTEEVLNSDAGRQWLPWFRAIFDRGQDFPPERAAQLVLFLAAGSADRLSGRLFLVPEDPAAVLGRAQEVEAQDLYTLRLRSLS